MFVALSIDLRIAGFVVTLLFDADPKLLKRTSCWSRMTGGIYTDWFTGS